MSGRIDYTERVVQEKVLTQEFVMNGKLSISLQTPQWLQDVSRNDKQTHVRRGWRACAFALPGLFQCLHLKTKALRSAFLLQMAWEKLHTGNWKDVAEVNTAGEICHNYTKKATCERAMSKTINFNSPAYHAVLSS